MDMEISIALHHPNAREPVYATDGAGAFDLFAAEFCDRPGVGTLVSDVLEIDTGVSVEVPPGHVMLVFSRSGDGFVRDLRLANCVGVIDPDYRGTVKVKLRHDGDGMGTKSIGDRVAQALVVAAPRVRFVVRDALSQTARGENGLGSTGA